VSQLSEAILEAAKIESPRAFRTVNDMPSLISHLSDVLSKSTDSGLDQEQIQEGSRLPS
jgi:hypothetical protein